MSALHLLAWFASGVFLINSVPHMVAGVQGRRFQSLFARPPGIGLSSPRTNVLWGFVNLALGWILLTQVGMFQIGEVADAAAVGAGVLLMGLFLGGYLGRFNADRE